VPVYPCGDTVQDLQLNEHQGHTVHGIRQEGVVCREGAEEGGIQYDQLIKYCMDECREIKDFIKWFVLRMVQEILIKAPNMSVSLIEYENFRVILFGLAKTRLKLSQRRPLYSLSNHHNHRNF
jgi:hypothetical protein